MKDFYDRLKALLGAGSPKSPPLLQDQSLQDLATSQKRSWRIQEVERSKIKSNLHLESLPGDLPFRAGIPNEKQILNEEINPKEKITKEKKKMKKRKVKWCRSLERWLKDLLPGAGDTSWEVYRDLRFVVKRRRWGRSIKAIPNFYHKWDSTSKKILNLKDVFFQLKIFFRLLRGKSEMHPSWSLLIFLILVRKMNMNLSVLRKIMKKMRKRMKVMKIKLILRRVIF